MSQQQTQTLVQAKLKMFSIHDKAKGSFLAPMLFSTLEEAKRFLSYEIRKNPDCLFKLYPGYYSLREIGEFDSLKGTGRFNLLPKEVSMQQIIEELVNDDKK